MYQKVISKIKGLLKGGFFHIFLGNTLVKMIAFVSSIVIVTFCQKWSNRADGVESDE